MIPTNIQIHGFIGFKDCTCSKSASSLNQCKSVILTKKIETQNNQMDGLSGLNFQLPYQKSIQFSKSVSSKNPRKSVFQTKELI